TERTAAMRRRDPCEGAVDKTVCPRVVRMRLDERLRQMAAEPRRAAAARHGVPLVADAAGVEAQRKLGTDLLLQGRFLRRNKAALAIGRVEAPLGEETPLVARLAATRRPLQRIERVVRVIGNRGERAEIEIALAGVLEGGKRRVLAEDLGSRAIGEL